jgi:metal-sulfur cluster biosynthetic enzyme
MCGPSLTRDAVLDALREIEDPEVGTSIVDLGLIRRHLDFRGRLRYRGNDNNHPLLPGFRLSHRGDKDAAGGVGAVSKAQVRLVYDPPWSPDMAELFSF